MRFKGGINKRLDRIEKRFNQLDMRLDKMRFDRMHDEIQVMLRWIVGTVGLFGAIVTVLVALKIFAG